VDTNKSYKIDGTGQDSNNFAVLQENVLGPNSFYANISNGAYYNRMFYMAKDYSDGCKVEARITIQPVDLIEVINQPTKVIYTVGESLDLTGLVVRATLGDDSTVNVPIVVANTSGFNSSAPVEDQVVTITLGNRTCTFTVDIISA
jgi:hypothetical protein